MAVLLVTLLVVLSSSTALASISSDPIGLPAPGSAALWCSCLSCWLQAGFNKILDTGRTQALIARQ
jgi:hypothetical protein